MKRGLGGKEPCNLHEWQTKGEGETYITGQSIGETQVEEEIMQRQSEVGGFRREAA